MYDNIDIGFLVDTYHDGYKSGEQQEFIQFSIDSEDPTLIIRREGEGNSLWFQINHNDAKKLRDFLVLALSIYGE